MTSMYAPRRLHRRIAMCTTLAVFAPAPSRGRPKQLSPTRPQPEHRGGWATRLNGGRAHVNFVGRLVIFRTENMNHLCAYHISLDAGAPRQRILPRSVSWWAMAGQGGHTRQWSGVLRTSWPSGDHGKCRLPVIPQSRSLTPCTTSPNSLIPRLGFKGALSDTIPYTSHDWHVC